MPVTIYGIANCETMKKARAWLDRNGVEAAFHDYRRQGIERARLEAWVKAVGWETLLNRGGMTFRKLPDEDKRCSPDGAERNPGLTHTGDEAPDCAPLHPGYACYAEALAGRRSR
jgi:glutaredoxin